MKTPVEPRCWVLLKIFAIWLTGWHNRDGSPKHGPEGQRLHKVHYATYRARLPSTATRAFSLDKSQRRLGFCARPRCNLVIARRSTVERDDSGPLRTGNNRQRRQRE